MRFLTLYLCLATGGAFAGEYAVLANGSRLHVDRHEAEAGKVRLYTGAGYVEMDALQVHSFEDDGIVPPPAAVEPAPVLAVNPAPVPEIKPALSPLELADAAADKYGLPRGLVRSVMAAESALRPGAVSPKGAIGLMQLMPATAKDLGVDPNDPVQNVDAGTRYLRDLLLKYDFGLWHALAAYNAGSGAVDKYQGIPPYRETVNYIRRIDNAFRKTAN